MIAFTIVSLIMTRVPDAGESIGDARGPDFLRFSEKLRSGTGVIGHVSPNCVITSCDVFLLLLL